MKVIINGQIYDSQKEPITLVWDTDLERQSTAKHLVSMESRQGPRMYSSFPSGADGHKVMDEAKELWTKSEKEPIEMTW